MKAILLGNGKSRKGADLQGLKDRGFIMAGCNALYRDFIPHVLAAMDQKMILEIEKAGAIQKVDHFVKSERAILRPNLQRFIVEQKSGRQLTKDAGWATGPALGVVLPVLYPDLTDVYLFGVDLYAMPETDGRRNNIYSNTNNYVADWEVQVSADRDCKDWARIFVFRGQLKWHWVRPFKQAPVPASWKLPNVSIIDSVEDFLTFQ
jgi:hypothetical protein